MHSTNPSTDEAVAQDNEREEEFFEDVPPYCGVWWRWGPFLLAGLLSWLAAGRVFGDAETSLSVIYFIVRPLLVLMFFQSIVFAYGLGWGAFVFALMRLAVACGFSVVCLGCIMVLAMDGIL